MTIASHLFRRRRVLAICAASVLLHYLAIGWVGAQLAAPGADTEAADPAEPVTIVAELRAPPAPASVPVPAPKPAVRPKSAPKRVVAPPPPVVQEPAPQAEAETGAAMSQAPVESPAAPELPALSDLPVAPEPETAPAPKAPGYKVSLPPSADLTMAVERTDAKGVSWSGQSVLSWTQGDGAYRMSMVASIKVLVSINLVELTSEGIIGETGIAPRKMTEKRRNRAATATHFDAQDGRISFSASGHSQPMQAGAQDKATFPMQLAGIARADPAQLAAGVEMLVGEDKDASLFRFVVVGQEELDTALGKMATWRLMRPPLPGSYKSRLDVWLAPGHNWYPVQLRSTEANGAVTTQTVNKIVIKNAEG